MPVQVRQASRIPLAALCVGFALLGLSGPSARGDRGARPDHRAQAVFRSVAVGIGTGEGQEAACALTWDRRITCWGARYRPSEVRAPSGRFLAVSVGGNESCAIDLRSRLKCWGEPPRPKPPRGRFISVASQDLTDCAVTFHHQIRCWDYPGPGSARPPGGRFVQVGGGSDDEWCAINIVAGIVCWGDFLTKGMRHPPKGAYIQVSVGSRGTACALRRNRHAVCFGRGWAGNARVYSSLVAPRSRRFREVAAGELYACGITHAHRLRCWGLGVASTCRPLNCGHGRPTTAPAGRFRQVATGDNFACAVRWNRSLKCWGANEVGQSRPPR